MNSSFIMQLERKQVFCSTSAENAGQRWKGKTMSDTHNAQLQSVPGKVDFSVNGKDLNAKIT